MGRPKSKKELEKDGNALKPKCQDSAHKGGDLNQWHEPQMEMVMDKYKQYKSFLFTCKNVLLHTHEYRLYLGGNLHW